MEKTKKKYFIPGMATALILAGMPFVSSASELEDGVNLAAGENEQEEYNEQAWQKPDEKMEGEGTALAEDGESGIAWRLQQPDNLGCKWF